MPDHEKCFLEHLYQTLSTFHIFKILAIRRYHKRLIHGSLHPFRTEKGMRQGTAQLVSSTIAVPRHCSFQALILILSIRGQPTRLPYLKADAHTVPLSPVLFNIQHPLTGTGFKPFTNFKWFRRSPMRKSNVQNCDGIWRGVMGHLARRIHIRRCSL